MSVQQEEGIRNHLSPRLIQKEEEDKEDKTLIGVQIMVGKDKVLDRPRIDMEIATEEVTIGKILVENSSRDRGRQNFRRNYSSDRSRSRERKPHTLKVR